MLVSWSQILSVLRFIYCVKFYEYLELEPPISTSKVHFGNHAQHCCDGFNRFQITMRYFFPLKFTLVIGHSIKSKLLLRVLKIIGDVPTCLNEKDIENIMYLLRLCNQSKANENEIEHI